MTRAMTVKKSVRRKNDRPEAVPGRLTLSFPDDEVFTCADCDMGIGRAEEMYNLPCNPETVTKDRLLSLVRCKVCAEKSANGVRVGEKGSGIFPLQMTIARMGSVVPRKDSRRLPQGKRRPTHKGKKSDDSALTGKRQRIRREKDDHIISWAFTYARTSFGDLVEDVAPKNQFGFCGVSVCGHRFPEEGGRQPSFLTRTDGELVAICPRCAAILGRIARQNRDDNRFKRLLSTRDLKLAQEIAARMTTGLDTRPRSKRSPLGANMSEEKKREKKARNLRNREQKREENRQRALSHGGGKKKQQSQGKGKKGRG